jgi:allene oxide cyclase
MRKRPILAGVAVLAVVACAVAAVAVAASRPQLTGPRTINVVEHPINEHVVDLGAGGDSAGDLLAFANPVFNAANTTRVGRDQGSCIRVIKGRSWQCSWTTFLPNGSITVEGPFFDTADSNLAITGGTGMFRNARGQMHLHTRADGNFLFSFYLQP